MGVPKELRARDQALLEQFYESLMRDSANIAAALFKVLDTAREEAFAFGYDEGKMSKLETDGAYKAGLAAGVARGRKEKRAEMLTKVQAMLEKEDG